MKLPQALEALPAAPLMIATCLALGLVALVWRLTPERVPSLDVDPLAGGSQTRPGLQISIGCARSR